MKTNNVYYKKASFFDSWKFNPLNWGSNIKITAEDNILKISYLNEGNSQITPYAFDDLFKAFFKNLELYLNNSINFQEKKYSSSKKSKTEDFNAIYNYCYFNNTMSHFRKICITKI